MADGFKGRPRVSQKVTLGALFCTILEDFSVILVLIPEVFLRYSQEIPSVFVIYSLGIPEVFLRYSLDILSMFLRYFSGIP